MRIQVPVIHVCDVANIDLSGIILMVRLPSARDVIDGIISVECFLDFKNLASSQVRHLSLKHGRIDLQSLTVFGYCAGT